MITLPIKVKCTLVQALRLCTGRTAHRGSRGIALPFHDHGTRRGWGSASRSGRSLPPGKIRYPLYRRLGGPQGRSGQVWKISPTPGFDPRTVQPVASRYTDYATRPITLPMAFTKSYAQKIAQVLGVHTFITIISANIYDSLPMLLNFHILIFLTFEASTRIIHVDLQLKHSGTAWGPANCFTGILIFNFFESHKCVYCEFERGLGKTSHTSKRRPSPHANYHAYKSH